MNIYEILATLQDPVLNKEMDCYVRERIPEFRQIVNNHPLRTPSAGCCSVAEAFWLFNLVRDFDPDLVVESGSFEGYSTYFLSRAVREGARVMSFDPFSTPKVRFQNVEYHASDWTAVNVEAKAGSRAIIFFDDHLHHGKRLMQAARRGFKHILFHDNYVTPHQSHVPIRFCNLLGWARDCCVMDRLTCDPIFTDTSQNPQCYRWLTYVRLLDDVTWWRILWRRLRFASSLHNPYQWR